ncbi:hypothetical protein EBB07_10540 [Paenibacillaceae bacterium]|nr:hypothetical protein EBB07_10540 [Paenibacillaceae bacterium]
MMDVIIIGAGPYGISLAAHAQAHGLSYRLFGNPMHFWKDRMPQNMFIRTNPAYVNLSDAAGSYTLERFAVETGTALTHPLPRPIFVRYALWFAEQTKIAFTRDSVAWVKHRQGGDGYEVRSVSGELYTARNVIVATGLQHFEYIPEVLRHLPPSMVSHPIGYADYSGFGGQRVAVIGSGQSSWEAAAMLQLAGSDVELLYRREEPNYSGADNFTSGNTLIELANTFYELPQAQKQERWQKPSGSIAAFLRPYVDGKVKQTGSVEIRQAGETADQRLRLQLSDGSERIVNHVIAATGYLIDIGKLPFLHPELLNTLVREHSGYGIFPQLDRSFESSLPGLYFAGPLASHSHGPGHRFIAGLHKACSAIIPQLAYNSTV